MYFLGLDSGTQATKAIVIDLETGAVVAQASEKAEAAAGAKARFIALNSLIANKYDALGSEKVGADYFTAADHTHTNELGARFNAQCVVEGIRKLKDCPLVEWLK